MPQHLDSSQLWLAIAAFWTLLTAVIVSWMMPAPELAKASLESEESLALADFYDAIDPPEFSS